MIRDWKEKVEEEKPRVPADVKDDDPVGAQKIHAQTSRPSGNEEQPCAWIVLRVERVDAPLASLDGHRSIYAEVVQPKNPPLEAKTIRGGL